MFLRLPAVRRLLFNGIRDSEPLAPAQKQPGNLNSPASFFPISRNVRVSLLNLGIIQVGPLRIAPRRCNVAVRRCNGSRSRGEPMQLQRCNDGGPEVQRWSSEVQRWSSEVQRCGSGVRPWSSGGATMELGSATMRLRVAKVDVSRSTSERR